MKNSKEQCHSLVTSNFSFLVVHKLMMSYSDIILDLIKYPNTVVQNISRNWDKSLIFLPVSPLMNYLTSSIFNFIIF